MATEKTNLETLLEKMAKLETAIAEERSKQAAETAIGNIGADVARFITDATSKAGIDVKVLHGKFFALSVADDGSLSVALAVKATTPKATNSTTTTTTPDAGKADAYEYFLAGNPTAYATVQDAMDALGVDKANRPAHNRWDRLSKDWQAKISRKAKATTPEAATPEATTPEATTPEATTPEANTPEANS